MSFPLERANSLRPGDWQTPETNPGKGEVTVMRGEKLRSPFFPVFLLLLPFIFTACSKEEPAAAALAAIEAAYEESELERAEKQEEFAPQYEAMAAEFWGTEAAFDAKIWLMTKGPRSDNKEERAVAIGKHTDEIFEGYARSQHMEKLGQHFSRYSEEQVEQYFGELRQNSPNAGVRAAAIYYPARSALSKLRSLEEDEAAARQEEINADLQLLLDEYSDVPKGGSTYGEIANAHLTAYTAEELAVGQPAPEIIAKTAAGEDIRLSDFLGKVTVIDFWGDW